MTEGIRKKRKQTILVAGGARGLGYEIGKLYAKAGHDLILVDKDPKGLGRVVGAIERKFVVQVVPVVQDLTHGRSAEKLLKAIQAQGKRVDVVVNRAGFRTYGPFSEKDLLRELRQTSAAFRVDSSAGIAGPLPLAGPSFALT